MGDKKFAYFTVGRVYLPGCSNHFSLFQVRFCQRPWLFFVTTQLSFSPLFMTELKHVTKMNFSLHIRVNNSLKPYGILDLSMILLLNRIVQRSWRNRGRSRWAPSLPRESCALHPSCVNAVQIYPLPCAPRPIPMIHVLVTRYLTGTVTLITSFLRRRNAELSNSCALVIDSPQNVK